jgi:hypothetical protein
MFATAVITGSTFAASNVYAYKSQVGANRGFMPAIPKLGSLGIKIARIPEELAPKLSPYWADLEKLAITLDVKRAPSAPYGNRTGTYGNSWEWSSTTGSRWVSK